MSKGEGQVRAQRWITREDLRTSPNTLYVFGDNMERRGLGGQAREMRGERNAVGIPTKWSPHRGESAFFRDSDLEAVRGHIDGAFAVLSAHLKKGEDVVFPSDGIGTGLAHLPRRAPKIYAHILAKLAALGEMRN